MFEFEERIDAARGAFEVVFGETNGAIFVNGPSDFRPDVGVGDGLRAGSEKFGLRQGLHPHFPVFSTHDGGGVDDLGFIGRLDGDRADKAFIGIDGFISVRLADRFEDRFMDEAGRGMGAARRRERVDDEINLAEIGADELEGLALNVGRECVAVDIFA